MWAACMCFIAEAVRSRFDFWPGWLRATSSKYMSLEEALICRVCTGVNFDGVVIRSKRVVMPQHEIDRVWDCECEW